MKRVPQRSEDLFDTDSTFELDLLIASSDAQRGLFEQAVNLVQTWNRYERQLKYFLMVFDSTQ